MGRHNFHPYLHISLNLNRIILHDSSSGVAGVVNHSSHLLILLLSTSSASSPYLKNWPFQHASMAAFSHLCHKIHPGLSSNPCKSEHLRAADLPLRQNYAHVGIGNVKDGGTFTLLHFSLILNCVYAVFLLKRFYAFCYIGFILPLLPVENESRTLYKDKILRLSCRS